MEIIYAAQPITAENIDELQRIYEPETVMCTPRNIPYKIGCVLIIRRIHIHDPLEPAMKTTLQSVWLTNRERLRTAFNIDPDPRRYNDFQIITLKE